MAQLSTNFSLLLLIAQTAFNVALPVIENASSLCTLDSENEDCREELMHPNMPTDMGATTRRINQGEDTTSYWLDTGRAHVAEKMKTAEEPQRGKAKNVIFFIGDGMSLVTQAATRIYLGGEEEQLSFEKFPGVGLAKTYSIDRLVPDSACTATAYLCGVKAMYGTIGVNGHVPRTDCNAILDEDNHVNSIAKWALDAGKSAGLVTTTRVTHASPAGVYAHVSERDWENDKAVRKSCGDNSGIDDIALQLMQGNVGQRLKVIMGGGKSQFIDADLYRNGKRGDGRNLIEEFVQQQEGNAYVETRQQLRNVEASNTTRLLALFNDDHLLYNLEAVAAQVEEQPTLAEMTAKAIKLLRENNEGYFLFVEGGRIDMAHHATKARLALDETAELSRAVEVAREMTSMEDTLIVVSADHSHTMSIAGYARRSNDIFGLASQGADDDVPYLTLSYANGPSFAQFYDNDDHVRVDPLDAQDGTFNDVFPATAPMASETHGGEDVGVFASGPWAHLFNGVYEQSVLPHIMGYAACLGEGLKVCGA